MDLAWVNRAVLDAIPEGWKADEWTASSDANAPVSEWSWIIESQRYDLGFYRLRLTADRQTLFLFHTTEINRPPIAVEEATIIHLEHFGTSDLSRLLRDILRTRRPIRICLT